MIHITTILFIIQPGAVPIVFHTITHTPGIIITITIITVLIIIIRTIIIQITSFQTATETLADTGQEIILAEEAPMVRDRVSGRAMAVLTKPQPPAVQVVFTIPAEARGEALIQILTEQDQAKLLTEGVRIGIM